MNELSKLYIGLSFSILFNIFLVIISLYKHSKIEKLKKNLELQLNIKKDQILILKELASLNYLLFTEFKKWNHKIEFYYNNPILFEMYLYDEYNLNMQCIELPENDQMDEHLNKFNVFYNKNKLLIPKKIDQIIIGLITNLKDLNKNTFCEYSESIIINKEIKKKLIKTEKNFNKLNAILKSENFLKL